MKEICPSDFEDIASHLGSPPELSAEMNRLIEHFDLASMHAEEQAIFLLEVGRLAHDEYARRIDDIRAAGGSVLPPYVECLRATVSALICGGV